MSGCAAGKAVVLAGHPAIPRMGSPFCIRRGGAAAVPYPFRLCHSLSGAAALTLGVAAPSALMQQQRRRRGHVESEDGARARGIRGWDVVAFHRWSRCEISEPNFSIPSLFLLPHTGHLVDWLFQQINLKAGTLIF